MRGAKSKGRVKTEENQGKKEERIYGRKGEVEGGRRRESKRQRGEKEERKGKSLLEREQGKERRRNAKIK